MLTKSHLNQLLQKTQSVFAAQQASLDQTGYIRDIESYLLDPDVCNPYTHVDIQFDFFDLWLNPSQYIQLDPSLYGTEVAVVGAGAAGMSAANLLLKVGLKPVVYEQSNRIGGRTYSKNFSQDPAAMCELGAMRIPESQDFIRQLRDYWNIKYFEFPDPKTVETQFDYQGKQVTYYPGEDGKIGHYEGDAELAKQIREMSLAYNEIISPITLAWDNATPQQKFVLWNNWVNQYANVSIFQYLSGYGWSDDQLALFYSLGGGTGGMGPFFQSAFLELVRIEIQKVEVDQYGITGGTEQFPVNFWNQDVTPPGLGTTSVSSINGNKTLGQVQEIAYVPGSDNPISITCPQGNIAFKAAILTPTPRAIQMTMDVDNQFFSDLVWRAIRQVTLTASNKTFILTKTAFWNEQPAEYPLTTTLTDQSPAQIYVFDKQSFGTDTESGVICVNYSWGDESTRFAALSDEQRAEISIEAIERIYGKAMGDKIRQETLEVSSINWESTYGYNAAWRMANPGQQQMHLAMLGQMMGAEPNWNKGLYLAGEALSHYGLSGWIDGAMKTGLIAALSAIKHLGGKFKP